MGTFGFNDPDVFLRREVVLAEFVVVDVYDAVAGYVTVAASFKVNDFQSSLTFKQLSKVRVLGSDYRIIT